MRLLACIALALAASLLVFYVLAMQCLPTVALAAREAGHWKWAALQLAWMSGVAYVSALVAAMPAPVFQQAKGWIRAGVSEARWAHLCSAVPALGQS